MRNAKETRNRQTANGGETLEALNGGFDDRRAQTAVQRRIAEAANARGVLQRIVIEDVTDQPDDPDVPVHQGPAPVVEEPDDDERALVLHLPPGAEPDEGEGGEPAVEELPEGDERALVPHGGGALVRGGGRQQPPREQVDEVVRRLAGLPAFESLLDRLGPIRIRSHIALQLGRMGGMAGLQRLLGGPAQGPGPGLGLPRLMAPRLALPPPALLRNELPQNPIELKVAQIHALGRPAHRSPYEVMVLASRLPAIPAIQLHALLSLPVGRSVTNLRYLVTGMPAHRTPGFMIALAAAHPGVSVANLIAAAQLPVARDGDLAALIAGVPGHVSLQTLSALAQALPARSAADLLALIPLFPQRSLVNLTALGGAPAHWSGADIALVATNCPASSVADIVALSQMPAARGADDFEAFCNHVTPTRSAANLAHLATGALDLRPDRLAPVAELPAMIGIAMPRLRATAIAFDRHDNIFTTVAQTYAALGTPLIAYSSLNLQNVVNDRPAITLVQLMTVLNWAHYADLANLRAILAHAKIDTAARLVTWLGNALVDDGNRLHTILQNAKIENALDIDYLLGRNYTLQQIGAWLTRAWATRAAGGPKTAVNGVIPLAAIPGVGGSPTQRYSPDQGSAWGGRVCHLSMSFSIQGPLAARQARYTGFHVSWRFPGAADAPGDPRRWYTCAGGTVAFANNSGPGRPAATDAEADGLMERYQTQTNTHW